MKSIKQSFHILALTLIAMVCTLFAPTMVHTVEQERDIQFGFPVEFVSMNSSYDMVERNGAFEYSLTNPRQHSMHVIWKGFWGSIIPWFIFANFLFILLSCLGTTPRLLAAGMNKLNKRVCPEGHSLAKITPGPQQVSLEIPRSLLRGNLFYIFLKKYYRTFEIFLTGFLFLFSIIAFFKFPFEIFILLFITTIITQLLNTYVARTK